MRDYIEIQKLVQENSDFFKRAKPQIQKSLEKTEYSIVNRISKGECYYLDLIKEKYQIAWILWNYQ